MAASLSTTKQEKIVRAIVFAVLLALPGIFSMRIAAISDSDLGWHLHTAEWIMQHHALPYSDPFTTISAGKPWQAYSWLYEVILLKLYQCFNLPGIVAYIAVMTTAITAAILHLVQRRLGDITMATLLTMAATVSLVRLYTPRPWLFTILFFIVELDILWEARASGRRREMYFLPVIFALWANMHIQFVDGLVLLFAVGVESLIELFRSEKKSALQFRDVVLVGLLSTACLCLNPYGWQIFQVAWGLASQSGAANYITEMNAMAFRDYQDFLVLSLAVAAVVVLARKKNSEIFPILALALGFMISFRSQRDLWFVVILSVIILADSLQGQKVYPERLPDWAWIPTLVGSGVLLAVAARVIPLSVESLQKKMDAELPVQAVNFVKAKGYKGPLFNNYDWGGYLQWQLRMPVALDGRAALHGDAALENSMKTWAALPGWQDNPYLHNSNLVIAPRETSLTEMLRVRPGFHVVYEDKIAVVFVADAQSSQKQ